MTKLPGFTLDLHENKQGQTFALILQQGFGLHVCDPSPHLPPQGLCMEIHLF